MAIWKLVSLAPWEKLADEIHVGIAQLFGVSLEDAEKRYEKERQRIDEHNREADAKHAQETENLLMKGTYTFPVPTPRPQTSAAIVGDLQRDMQAREEEQIGAIAQALHEAERDTTSFTHNLGFHRDIARKIYAKGVRYEH